MTMILKALHLAWGHSLGATNNITVYGGLQASSEYQNVAFGLGRDFAPFGVLSGNINISRAQMGRLDDNETLTGNSYNLTYSKQFDEINSQITFAGYRFSERNYMTMSQFIDRRYKGDTVDSGKELYTIIFGTAFPDYNANMYLNYSHQTYWNRASTNQYNFTLSNYFDIGKVKNISLSLTAYKTKSRESDDDGIYLNLMIPLDKNESSISYSGSYSGGITPITLTIIAELIIALLTLCLQVTGIKIKSRLRVHTVMMAIEAS